MRILIYDIGDGNSCTDEELGMQRESGYTWLYEIKDKELFFLSVIKYGIKFKKEEDIDLRDLIPPKNLRKVYY